MALAAFRIFMFNAAFPFFNNVDEQCHFDLVYRYSLGEWPREAVPHYSKKNAEMIVLYETPEYFTSLDKYPRDRAPQPLWKYPFIKKSSQFTVRVERRMGKRNHEAGAFPLPYFLAGLWSKGGKTLGLEGGNFLYWMRFINVPLFVLLVWLSWMIARSLFPGDVFQRIGLPMMITFFPQDLFYGITNDTFSALFFALSFFLLLQIYLRERSIFYHAFAGFAVALTFLLKNSNISVVALLILVIILKVRRLFFKKNLAESLPKLLALIFFSVTPIALMLFRNYLVLGDFMGTSDMVSYLSWTTKPLSELFQHPIFTPKGFCYFSAELTKTFWRGEFIWHGQDLAYPWADLLFIITTGVFFLFSAFSLFRKPGKNEGNYRSILLMSFFVVAVSVLFLIFISTRFDFGNCFYPSKKFPYFVSGRLISCVIIPFFLIFLSGTKTFFKKIGGETGAFVFIALFIMAISISEIFLTWKVFGSAFNWFHLGLH